MTGRPLNAKLFLEGIEVPIIGATVTFTVNSAAIAYIDVVPHKSLNNIKPRTMVHLFVRDFQNPEAAFPYILMFEGEVFGFSFGKTTTSRTLSLSCIDFSSYWDNALIYFMDPMKSLGKGAEMLHTEGQQQAEANKQNVDTVVSHSTTSFFLQTISSAKGDFLDGLVAVYQKLTKINSFYKLAEQKLHINERITLKSSSKLTELLKQAEARQWFGGIVGSYTGYQTLRGVVQDLMGTIFHDGITVPFPALVGGKLIEFVFKPNMYMLPPPTCNIFYPDEYSSFQYNRNFFQEPTRLIYQPSLPLFGAGVAITLPHAYAPDSFAHFMKAKGITNYIGTGDLQVSADKYGFYQDPDTDPGSSETNNGLKREQQFLTNEERMKGLLLTNETMVPAATQFQGSIGQEGNANNATKIATYLFFKKRFQQREVQVTSHLKPSVVPGFNVLILDDSAADQSVLAYCSSVTHRIYCNQGGYTNATLSYARTVEEQSATAGKYDQPLIPPWFDAAIFGSVSDGQLKVTSGLDTFYKTILGNKATQSITGYAKKANIVEATNFIKQEYIASKNKGIESVNTLIRKATHRDYVSMTKTFSTIGASTKTKDQNTPYMEFTGMLTTDMDLVRKAVVKAYRDVLRAARGFRG